MKERRRKLRLDAELFACSGGELDVMQGPEQTDLRRSATPSITAVADRLSNQLLTRVVISNKSYQKIDTGVL